ncbi:hypothetical protein Hanom_Chr04g00304661 [Helianthus anomalus]
MVRILDSILSSLSNVITLSVVRVDILVGLSPLSALASFVCLFSAEHDVPQMLDPPEMKLIILAYAEGDAARSGSFSVS